MAAANEGKLFTALLNGLAKRIIFQDPEFTDALLKDQIYPNLDDTAFGALLALAERLLVNSAQDDLDLQQAEEAAAAAGLTEGQKQGFLKFWKAQKQKIHEQLVKDALWGSRLKAFSWRIDVKTKSKHIRELNEPTAVLELDVANNDQTDIVRFEMDAAQVRGMLEQLERIESVMSQ